MTIVNLRQSLRNLDVYLYHQTGRDDVHTHFIKAPSTVELRAENEGEDLKKITKSRRRPTVGGGRHYSYIL